MRRFYLRRVVCESCRRPQQPGEWDGRCPDCSGASFQVAIERAASGWEALELLDLIPRPGIAELMDDPFEPYWHTRSALECSGVTGDELQGFRAASIEDRRRMYIGWKRRELESRLSPENRVCSRCGVIFKEYANSWNRSGYCSRACWSAALKAKRKAT